MKKFKKTLSLILALVMCLSLANITVFAAETEETLVEAEETLAEVQDTALAPQSLLGIFDHNWGDWEKLDDECHQRTCRGDITSWFCRQTETRPHDWDNGTVKGNYKEYKCTTCGATKYEDLPEYPVYVYVRVTGSTENVDFDNLNGAGWFTIGKVMVPGLANPANYSKDTVLEDDNLQKVTDVVLSQLDRYDPEDGLDLTDGIEWSGQHTITTNSNGDIQKEVFGLKRSEGANDYLPDGMDKDTWDSYPTWHLDGVLTISERYTVIYTDGAGQTVFKDEDYTYSCKWGSDTPAFKVNGEVANPTREGYVFKGWSPAFSYRVTGNVTYVAQWQPKVAELEVTKTAVVTGPVKPGDEFRYQITVRNLGSTEVKNVVITDVLDSNLEFVEAAGPNNIFFVGAENKPDNDQYAIGDLAAKDVTGDNKTLTITARVKDGATGTISNTATVDCDNAPATKPSDTAEVTVAKPAKEITLFYDAGEGTGAPKAQTETANADGEATFTVSAIEPTREGYTFGGWAKGTSTVKGGDQLTITDDYTLKALWNKKTTPVEPDPTCTLKVVYEFYLDGVKQDSLTRTVVNEEKAEGTVYNVVILETLDGYTTTQTSLRDQTLTEDTTITVRYDKTTPPKPEEPEQVIYQWLPGYGGTSDVPGTTEGAYKRETVNADDPVPEAPANPTREGYAFKGWSDAVETTNKGRKVITYTAQWAKLYTVTYNLDGGTSTSAELTYTVPEGDETPTIANPTRSGYTFNGWNTEVAKTVTADVTYTAQWTQNYVPPVVTPTTYYTLTVHYVYADGTTAAPSATRNLTSGTRYTVDSPVIEGYTPDRAVVSGNLYASDTLTVTYTANAIPQHTVTVRPVDEAGSPIGEDVVVTVAEGEDYAVSVPVVEGYTPDQAEVTGIMGTEDTVVTVTYTEVPEETDIGDDNPPLVDNPDVDPDPDVDTPPEEVDIGEEDTPLVDVPQTGDLSMGWYAALMLSICGLVLLNLKRRKILEG